MHIFSRDILIAGIRLLLRLLFHNLLSNLGLGHQLIEKIFNSDFLFRMGDLCVGLISKRKALMCMKNPKKIVMNKRFFLEQKYLRRTHRLQEARLY